MSKRRKTNNNGKPSYTKPYERIGKKQQIQFTPGYERIAGYYGRYNRPGDDKPEFKFHDLDIDDAVIAQNGNIAKDSCNLIAQGVTESQRIGRKCTIKSINWRYSLSLPEQDAGGTPFNGDIIRVILYLDKQTNGATATVTGILESDDYQSFNNLANKGRFRTLMDRTHDVNFMGGMASDNAAVVSQVATEYEYSFFKKCNIPLEFDSTTGAITELRSNNIGVLLLSKAGAIVAFGSKMRLRYSDR